MITQVSLILYLKIKILVYSNLKLTFTEEIVIDKLKTMTKV